MSKPSPVPLLIDTAMLSAIISETLSIAGVSNTKKQACLNAAARRIAGPKHNWGYLTGHEHPVLAQGLKSLKIVKPLQAQETFAPWPEMPHEDYPDFVANALDFPAKAVVLAGPPGIGMLHTLKQAAQAKALPFLAHDFGAVGSEDITIRDASGKLRLLPEFRPMTQDQGQTVYMDFDHLSDDALEALAHEIYDLRTTSVTAKVWLTSSRPKQANEKILRVMPALSSQSIFTCIAPPSQEGTRNVSPHE